MPVHRSVAVLPTASTLPVGDAAGKGYSQSDATLDLCVNVLLLVRPTHISPRQSGAAGPCSTLRRVHGKARI